MNQEEIRKQILDYHAGKLTPAEKEQLLEALDLLTTADLEILYPAADWKEYLHYSPVSAAATEEALRRQRRLQHTKHRFTIGMPMLKAACIAGTIAVGIYWFTRTTGIWPGQPPVVAFKTIHVPDGPPQQFTLPDSSRLTVNGGTTLRVPANFAEHKREVFLTEGEAFFVIQEDAAHPFVVHTGTMDVQVLGTSFSIRDYKEETKGTVSVRTGKVAVAAAGEPENPLQLLPGYSSTLDKAAHTITHSVADTTVVFGWMNGNYTFRSATLGEIIRQLQHGYAVQFVVQNKKLLEKRFSASFRKSSITDIMEQLQLMSNIQYTIQNKTIIIQ